MTHKKFKYRKKRKEGQREAGKIKFQVGIILTFIIGKYCTNGCEWLLKIANAMWQSREKGEKFERKKLIFHAFMFCFFLEDCRYGTFEQKYIFF